ncbi:hypothetical protein [Chitinophaga nivalis]|uniref:Uncharacterized protein n=1 Tax=Chitinophaga nivalis TaxID=2991709 RepID=A0ABT3II06_9BACT|nr:hypothetical protein [Chitinophaga nivalis]MCW3466727.1 hypothetical protein [Chitinophaga nivalis]MCW3483582.1 hypothetical protein [Chitinophaga nivalis]
MSVTVFTSAIVLLLLAIVRQLILLYSTFIRLHKDNALCQVRIKEEKEYLLIKGLY